MIYFFAGILIVFGVVVILNGKKLGKSREEFAPRFYKTLPFEGRAEVVVGGIVFILSGLLVLLNLSGVFD